QRRSRPRVVVDPVAGIEVIEGGLPGSSVSDTAVTQSIAQVEPSVGESPAPESIESIAAKIDPTQAVDLDIGAPVILEERVNWFGDRVQAAANDAGETVEQSTATAKMLEVASAS